MSIFLTAGNSPWSNGKNERNHYTCDMTIDKLMAEDSKMLLVEPLSHATYAHNVQIKKKGLSPIQLTFGRQGVIPGITDGNPASLEPVVDSDWFRQELTKRQRAEELYRKIDSNERLRKLLVQKTSGATDAVYVPGDEVLFKEKDKSKWSGLAKVNDVIGNKVRMIYGRYERTVPSVDVAYFKDEKTVVRTNKSNENKETKAQTLKNDNAEDWQTEDVLPTDWQLKNNRRTRPKLHDNIEFTVDGFLRAGQVKRVGKVNGKDKNRCWIKEGDVETSYGFINDIEHWRTMKKNETFSKEAAGINITAGIQYKGWKKKESLPRG